MTAHLKNFTPQELGTSLCLESRVELLENIKLLFKFTRLIKLE